MSLFDFFKKKKNPNIEVNNDSIPELTLLFHNSREEYGQFIVRISDLLHRDYHDFVWCIEEVSRWLLMSKVSKYDIDAVTEHIIHDSRNNLYVKEARIVADEILTLINKTTADQRFYYVDAKMRIALQDMGYKGEIPSPKTIHTWATEIELPKNSLHYHFEDTCFADLILNHAKFILFFDDISTKENRLGWVDSGKISIIEGRDIFLTEISSVIWLAHLNERNFPLYSKIFSMFKDPQPLQTMTEKADYVRQRLPKVDWGEDTDLLDDLYDLVWGYSCFCKNLVQANYRKWLNLNSEKYVSNKQFNRDALLNDLNSKYPMTKDIVADSNLSATDIITILLRDIYSAKF